MPVLTGYSRSMHQSCHNECTSVVIRRIAFKAVGQGEYGMLKNAIFSLPNCLEGYTADDNARALIVATLVHRSAISSEYWHAPLSRRCLAFLWLAFRSE